MPNTIKESRTPDIAHLNESRFSLVANKYTATIPLIPLNVVYLDISASHTPAQLRETMTPTALNRLKANNASRTGVPSFLSLKRQQHTRHTPRTKLSQQST